MERTRSAKLAPRAACYAPPAPMFDDRTRLDVAIAGGDTARTLNLRKRVATVERVSGGLRGKRVLDCGCGAGDYTRAYARLGARAIGVEYQRTKLQDAMRAPDPRVELVRGDITALPIRDHSVDLVVLNEVLEHVPDDAAALREARRVLAADGLLVVLSPNRVYPFESHGVRRKGASERLPIYTPLVPYVPLWLGQRVLEYWARNYWPWELRALVRANGFSVTETSFLAQTFENITGDQPPWMARAAPVLRAVLDVAERVPVAQAFCSVSQVVVARPAR